MGLNYASAGSGVQSWLKAGTATKMLAGPVACSGGLMQRCGDFCSNGGCVPGGNRTFRTRSVGLGPLERPVRSLAIRGPRMGVGRVTNQYHL